MTPFGRRLRELRRGRGKRLKDMAAALGISAAYLSALEHGHRGRPGGGFVQQVSAYFNLAWDDVDELRRLAELSHPRVVVDTSGLDRRWRNCWPCWATSEDFLIPAPSMTGQSHLARLLPFSPLSFPRKRESRGE